MEWFYYEAVASHTENKLITTLAAAYQPCLLLNFSAKIVYGHNST